DRACNRLLEDLVLAESRTLEPVDVAVGDLVGVQANLLEVRGEFGWRGPVGARGGTQRCDQLVVARSHVAGSATTSASMRTRPSRASECTASRSSSESGRSAAATSLSVSARR